jgi:hypothetical protein
VDHTACTASIGLARTRAPGLMTPHRKVIGNIATSADGYIARPDGDLECRHRLVPLELLSTERSEDGLVQLPYRVPNRS